LFASRHGVISQKARDMPDHILSSCLSDVVSQPRRNVTAVLFDIKSTVLT